MKKIILGLSLVILFASGFISLQDKENDTKYTAVRDTGTTIMPLVNKIGPGA